MLKRKSKRVLSIVLAVAMIVGLFPIAAFADDGATTAEAKTISVDGTTTTLASAAQQANDGDTIQLTSDIKLQTGVDFDDTVTLDLNGHTIADENWTSGDYLVSVKRGGELTIEDSSTDQTGAITASSSNEKLYAAVKITLTGEDEATTPANLIVNGGTLTGYYYGIAGNGTRHNTNIEINGGKIVGTNGAGIYHPQDGVLTVTNGEITGEDTAIELRSGKLNISGGSFTATASEYAESQNNSGTTVSGAAIAISQHTTKKNISVNITGGTFNGVYALSETNVQNADATENVEIVAINGGTFNGKVKSSDCTKFVSGGSFNEQVVADYVATGYECVKDESSNMYVIQTASQMEASSEVSDEGTASTTVGGSFTPSTETGDNVNTTDTTLNITATTGSEGTQNDSVTTSNVTIAPEALTSVNNATSVQNVAIKTDVATVTVDSAAWNAMTTNADTESVTLSVEKTAAEGNTPLTYTLKATNASGNDVYSASNAAGAITISVRYTETNPQVFYVGDNGLEKMNATLENQVLSWVANHFSDYVVLSDDAVATVKTDSGVTEYDSLQNAITAAKDNGTVTLVNNVNLTDGVEVEGTVTLDLNGYTITDKEWNPTDSADYLLAVKRDGNLMINDNNANKAGAITTTNERIVVAVKLTIKGESTEENAEAATLTVNGGTLKAPFYGISGNGTRHNTNLTINGGAIEGTEGTGIYQPQDGTVTINGGTITGLTGIEIRSGQLNVNGGTIKSTADKYEEAENGGGTTVTGAAIAVSQHTTDKKITVTVDGGTFEGPKSFVETDVQKVPVGGSFATINKGTFVGEVISADFTNIVKGGQFSAPVAPNLLDDTLTAQLQSTSNTTAPYSYYTSVQAAVNAAAAGDAITVLVNTDENVVVSKPVTIVAAGGVTQTGTISAGNGYDVTVDENGNIVIVKEPEYNGKYSYEIFTKVGENGTISVDRYATEGDDVTITVSPDEAYLLDELTVTANGKEIEVKDNGDGTYTFKMPSADAKIVVTFAEDPDWEPAPEMPFTDVNEGDWFYDVVLYAYDNGLMTGVSATEFAPNQTTTRGMIVSMLARLEGVTSAEGAGFADVAANDWYATAVNWAASVGVVNGYEDDTFRPNDAITREQMAAILYNYADYKGYDVSARADLSDYADAASISSWAEDVLAWANAEGLINGMTATTIDPQGATTRAQTAAMFERFLTAHEA